MTACDAPPRPTWRPPAAPQVPLELVVRLWDLHAARRLVQRLVAAGVAPQAIAVRGLRCHDGLAESDVMPSRRMTTRWRTNAVVAVGAAVIVGLPMGAAVAVILLGEHAVVMSLGALVGAVSLGAAGLWGVWGDHFQRIAGSRPESRVEGWVTVAGTAAQARAEMLLAAIQRPDGRDDMAGDVLAVTRRPASSA